MEKKGGGFIDYFIIIDIDCTVKNYRDITASWGGHKLFHPGLFEVDDQTLFHDWLITLWSQSQTSGQLTLWWGTALKSINMVFIFIA